LNFLKRAKLNGSDVERFKKFTDVIITSAQPKK
jgi:hypothetical protein